MKILTLILAIIWMAIFRGCKDLLLTNHFITYGNGGGYASTCETLFSDYPIGVEKLYELKSRNDLKAPIYIIKDGNFTIADVRKGIFGVVPIESCGDKWCKIYYPCSETEYFIKKGDIVKRDY
ncbi:hypothetical protein [uncultured Campylobacter sp.]|mgnify:CR=1 FL=1|uniref:hypothetical protein n=1 Tax=uncultured Campylobacter sp. TaxID=218934 RepID=UPI002621DFDA|nr:hypothetical protein [uncultured Campylobacter sp.]